MSKLSLEEAIQLLDNKKGAGVSKVTKVKIEFSLKCGIVETRTALQMVKSVLEVLFYMNRLKELESEVVTEMESNPDWK